MSGNSNYSLQVSSYEVARLAGVSQATVSRVFSPGKAKVSAATRERVLAVARQLNYHPSIIARSLSNKSTRIVAFICGRIEVEHFSKLLSAFAGELHKHGYTTLFIPHPADSNAEETIPLALQYKVDGIVITTSRLSSKLAELCKGMGTAVVLFGRYSINAEVSSVCLDNLQAGRLAAEYLLQRGHKRLAFMAGDTSASSNQERQRGFLTAAGEQGMAVRVVEAGDYGYEAGCQAAQHMLNCSKLPDGVFCGSDYLAAGLLDVARQQYGLDIPGDLSVIGLNDDLIAKLSSYNLTTIQQPLNNMVSCAVEILLAAMEDNKDSATTKRFPGILVERATVADR